MLDIRRLRSGYRQSIKLILGTASAGPTRNAHNKEGRPPSNNKRIISHRIESNKKLNYGNKPNHGVHCIRILYVRFGLDDDAFGNFGGSLEISYSRAFGRSSCAINFIAR